MVEGGETPVVAMRGGLPSASAEPSDRGPRATVSAPTPVRPFGLTRLLWPLAVVIAALVGVYGGLSIASNYARSVARQESYTTPVHADTTVVTTPVRAQVPEDAVTLVYRDVGGELRRVMASESAVAGFTNAGLGVLATESRRLETFVADAAALLFATVFADGDERIDGYADWYFEWGRSWDLLKKGVTATIDRFGDSSVETLREAVERDLSDYFMEHFSKRVLKPEIRDPLLQAGIRRIAREAHERFLMVVAQHDLRLQLFLARHTTHLRQGTGGDAAIDIRFDWDAQRWKAPTHLMEGGPADGIRSLLTIGAGGTLAGSVLAPIVTELASEVAMGLVADSQAASAGAAVGSGLFPGLGTVVGVATGIAAAAGIDFVWSKTKEALERDEFVARNREALTGIQKEWLGDTATALQGMIGVWFKDAAALYAQLQQAAAPVGGSGTSWSDISLRR